MSRDEYPVNAQETLFSGGSRFSGVPLRGRAIRYDEDISAAIPHANDADCLTVFVRRGQGTPHEP